MVLEKERRNREFVRAWKNLGLGNDALAERFSMTVGGVKSLKSRLRKKRPELYSQMIDRKAEGKSELPVREKKKVSFYMTPDLVIKLKIAAAAREVTASELAEKLLHRGMAEEGML